jgi:hypothetical protein
VSAPLPKACFDKRGIVLPLDKILPIRLLKDGERNLGAFRTIVASLRAVGLLEPLVVHPEKTSGRYSLVDGNLRYYALKEIGQKEALCIVTNDDESYTYNHFVNRLAPIQAHNMIMRAVKNGVDPQSIADALHVDVKLIQSNMNLLVGIHPDVVELLKDKQVPSSVFYILKKVMPLRQIEMAELMASANNFTKGYAQALLTGTLKDDLVNPEEPKKAKGLTAEELARMEQEMALVSRDFKAVETTYGETVLHLTLAKTYLGKLLANARVSKFLSTRHEECFAEFQKLAATGKL